MAKISKNDFLACVKKSRVIDDARLDQFLSEAESDDPVELATKMVRDQLLTRWQAKYLMAGRSRLDIGSYRLLDRISRDELGDRFLATHKQLGRKVDIQILPADVSKDQNRCESFLQTAGEVAKLDHPNLVHVYDIDQEGGRYFLVTEHVEGVTLESAAADSMSSLEVGRLVSQAIAGIEFAHEHNVTHGSLRQSDFVLADDRSVKIKHLAVASLRTPESDGEADDVQAIVKVGRQLLAEIPADDESSRLEGLLHSLASGEPSSISAAQQEISDWIAEQDDEFTSAAVQSQETEFSEPVANDRSFDSEDSDREADADDYEDEEYEDEEDDYEDDEFEDEATSYLGRLVNENPVGLIATLLVLAVLLVGGTAWGTYSYMSNASMAKKIAEAKAQTTNPSNKKSKQRSDRSQRKDKTQSQVSKTAGVLSQPVDAPAPDFKDTEAMQRLIAQSIPGDSPGPPPVAAQPAVENPPAPKENPAAEAQVTPNDPEEVEIAYPADDITTELESESNPIVPSATGNMFGEKNETPADAEEVDPPESKKVDEEKPANPSPATVAADVDPFEKFPRLTDLPPIEELQETSLGKLVISNRYLMGAELYADPAIGKGRMIFDLNRDNEDKQKWIVTVRRREKERPTEIAFFRKSESEFLFSWLPDAERNKNAQFLRNCIIKLKVPEFSHWLTLRKPIELEPIVLTAESPIFKIETEIPHLPRLEEISIEILPVRDIPDVETTLEPPTIEFSQGIPGRILLKESDANAFVWIEVGAELKSKLKLQSSFVLLLANGRREPIKKLQALDELAASLKQYEMKAFNDYEIAKNTRAPSGKGEEYDQIRSELEKAANRAKSQTIKAAEYATLVPKFLGQPISIRIYAKLGDHRTELAVTKKSSE